jgi:hypothetical protein
MGAPTPIDGPPGGRSPVDGTCWPVTVSQPGRCRIRIAVLGLVTSIGDVSALA